MIQTEVLWVNQPPTEKRRASGMVHGRFDKQLWRSTFCSVLFRFSRGVWQMLRHQLLKEQILHVVGVPRVHTVESF